MVALAVDRMRTRYVGEAVRFDTHLRQMVDEELPPALAAVPLPPGHVCLRRLTVPVRLGPSGVVARSWAEQIAVALARAIGAGEDVQVYPRTLDALTDLLVSLGRGDLSRAWAWRQLGLVAADPGRPDAAAVALLRHPDLVCAALAAAAQLGPLPLTAAGWAAVARAVAELAGEPTAAGPAPAAAVAAVLGAPVPRRLPATVAELPTTDIRAVARLLLLCAAPSLSRSGPAIAAVADLLRRPPASPAGGESAQRGAGLEPPPAGSPGAGQGGPDRTGPDCAGPDRAAPDRRSRPGPPDGVLADPRAATDPAPRPDDPPRAGDGPALIPRPAADPRPDPILPAGPPASAVSLAAGVLFLIAATGIPDLRSGSAPPLAPAAGGAGSPGLLADRPLSVIVGWLGARLGEVGIDDPAVSVLAGQPREPLDPPGPAEEAALTGLADEVRAWLRELLRLELGDDLRWLWRRPARIAATPGWVEATYALEEVDTRVRAAGLDLDPGFVWWLGAVVRYRYA